MKKLDKKNVNKSNVVPKSFATNPIASHNALELFARQTDIKKFANLVMQDEISDEFLANTQAELLMKDVFDPFDENSYKRLAENEQLLKDLTTDMD